MEIVSLSDKIEIELFGHNDKKEKALTDSGQPMKPKNIIPSLKHAGNITMLWAVSATLVLLSS